MTAVLLMIVAFILSKMGLSDTYIVFGARISS